MGNRFPGTLARVDGSRRATRVSSPRVPFVGSLLQSRERERTWRRRGSIATRNRTCLRIFRVKLTRDQVAYCCRARLQQGSPRRIRREALLLARVPVFNEWRRSKPRLSLPLNLRCISNLKFWRRDEGISSRSLLFSFSLLSVSFFFFFFD